MVKKKGGGKKQVLHLSEFLGDTSPVNNAPAPVWNEDANTDLSLPRVFAFSLSLSLCPLCCSL